MKNSLVFSKMDVQPFLPQIVYLDAIRQILKTCCLVVSLFFYAFCAMGQDSRITAGLAYDETEICTYAQPLTNGNEELGAIIMTTHAVGPLPGFSVTDSAEYLIFRKIMQMDSGNYSVKTIITPVNFHKSPATIYASLTLPVARDSNMIFRYTRKSGKLFYALGEDTCNLTAIYTEDDLWTRAMINPQILPLGKISIVPSLEYLQQQQINPEAERATAQLNLQINADGSEWYHYSLNYTESGRQLKFTFRSTPPYNLLWYHVEIPRGKNDQELRLSECKTDAQFWQDLDAAKIWKSAGIH